MREKPSESCHILLADDDPDVRGTLRLLLELDEHSVVEACNGRQALDLLRSQRFDLVITDYIMPELSGDKLAIEIKRDSPSLPVIMITAHADVLPAALAGVDLLLSKPFQITELRGAICKVSYSASPHSTG